MAVLGVSQIDFDKRTYEDFMVDAKKISKVLPSYTLIWGRGPKALSPEEFKRIEEQYLSSCKIQGRDEYSEVSLTWAKALFEKIHTFNKLKDEDLKLFEKIFFVFKNLHFSYQTKQSDNICVKIIENALENYNSATEIMSQIVNYLPEFKEKTYENFLEDAKDFIERGLEDISSFNKAYNSGMYICNSENSIYIYYERFLKKINLLSQKILFWTLAFDQYISKQMKEDNNFKFENSDLNVWQKLHNLFFKFYLQGYGIITNGIISNGINLSDKEKDLALKILENFEKTYLAIEPLLKKMQIPCESSNDFSLCYHLRRTPRIDYKRILPLLESLQYKPTSPMEISTKTHFLNLRTNDIHYKSTVSDQTQSEPTSSLFLDDLDNKDIEISLSSSPDQEALFDLE